MSEFHLHAQSIGDPVHKSEVTNDGARVMNGAIAVACGAERVDLVQPHRLRRQRQYVGIAKQRSFACAQMRRCHRRSLQTLHHGFLIRSSHAILAENRTETRSVMVQSIVAAVQR